ncbi:MAG TPA: 50S ribosomal protein L25/general stress protein Ctc [Bauldia sp.]|nr:50S ribosomal protein L25/general stress protein Ctc [Bauldia sp.]
MGASYELTATVREKVGKGAARAVRREGHIPAVIYGGKEPPIAINLSDRDVYFKIHAGGFLTTVAEIKVNGQTIRTLPRDFQLDPVTDRPLHVDFLRITPGSRIKVEVPVQFVNEADAPGIRRGGVLNVVRHRVELLCPADGIPDRIVADLTGLDINDSLHISRIALPEGVKPTIARDFTVATIAAPAGVKEELRAAAEAAAAAAAAAEAVAGAAPAGEVKAEGGEAKKPEPAAKPEGGKK